MNAEHLEVVQNFAVDGPNRGLLCVVADVVKPAPPLPTLQQQPRYKAPEWRWRKVTAQHKVEAALKAQPQTQRQLEAVCGLSGCQVRVALHLLRRRGQLETERRSVGLTAKASAVYRLRESE